MNRLKLFGEKIRKLRIERGLSQEKLAFLSGLHRTYLGAIERGERNVSFKNIEKIAKTLKVSLEELFRNI
ncbi:MAG TPA: XRE family transcriptional regulator [Anaerolineae bacterium]|nr:XRE family transcriptional regulator [Anaerolineae bacterium]